eukprot:CAMPEP_0116975794 /NCGR_PEP_ID=MMETSP0467-20121206/56044_1 /TAXON_ID=283647 /ORGANISM="Mesodinium pulex, Strain SPMC105" /LENGTH=37 /DNA_ID= /DNA_START= /DNA_END= /DNA_ORIENTATION=
MWAWFVDSFSVKVFTDNIVHAQGAGQSGRQCSGRMWV